jgi:glutamate decarboxylase
MPDKPADLRSDLEIGIYGTHAADISVPKLKMPEGGLRFDVAHALVRDELFLDGNARQNLHRAPIVHN